MNEIVIDGFIDHDKTFNVKLKVNSFIEKGIEDVKVMLNSSSGSFIETLQIASELEKIKNVKIIVQGVCYGASIYLLSKFNSSAKKEAQFKVELPIMAVSGDEVQIKNQLEALKNITDLFLEALSKKIRKDKQETFSLFKDGSFFLNSSKAVEIGLINSLVDAKNVEANITAYANYLNERNNWTFDDFATKDPEALKEMMFKDPKRFKALEYAHYGK